ncbi:MAG: efflux RND transporter periplasmic adaptor subunit [Bacteroidales bacterium]|nr:efflux RND transporter periplasmic adaptor subunit [Bacteroidales bacterium]
MKKTIRTISLALLASVFAVACKNEETVETKVDTTPLVKLAVATTEVVADDQVYSSTVKPWAKNNIAPQQGGRIEELLVEVGTYVNAGETVAKMEDVQLQQSQLQIMNDEVELKRMRTLKDQGGISLSDFEAFEMACKVHKSTYDNLLRNTVLRSPLTGMITARNYDKGDMYAMAQPIYTVEQIIPVKLYIAVSEADYSKVKKGAVTTVTTDAFPGQKFSGEITNIFPTIDPVTHTFNVEIKVKNFDKKLRPGMYAKVTIIFDKVKRVIVPDVAVVKQTGSGDRFVYVYDAEDGTVEYRKVEVGRRLGNKYVILGGLKAGEKIVTEGLLRLKNGVAVKVAE